MVSFMLRLMRWTPSLGGNCFALKIFACNRLEAHWMLLKNWVCVGFI